MKQSELSTNIAPMKKSIVSILLAFVFIGMLSTTIVISYQSNLFEVFSSLWTLPWFKATLIDFYFNQFIIYLIVLHLEKYRFIRTIPWLIAFICLGSMASAVYFLYYINFKSKGIFDDKQLN